MRLGWPALVLILLARPGLAQQRIRLEGLDRVYFERVRPSAASRDLLPPDTLALPDSLATITPEPRRLGVRDEIQVTVRDFRVPGAPAGHALILRQAIDGSHPRITRLWWALYDNGRRGEVWYFTALPDRNDNKVLTNYEIEDIAGSGATVVSRVRGTMYRPQGVWSMVGKHFVFIVQDTVLALTRVRNVFGFFGSTDDGQPSVAVRAEAERGGRYEERAVAAAAASRLRRCGFDPEADDGVAFDWAALERAAACVTAGRDAERRYRGLDEPSFAERERP
jgi:hypothetical protein